MAVVITKMASDKIVEGLLLLKGIQSFMKNQFAAGAIEGVIAEVVEMTEEVPEAEGAVGG